MRSYCSIHPVSSLYDLHRHAKSLQALQKRTNVRSEKGSGHSQNTKNRGGRLGNSLSTVNFINTGGGTLPTTAAPTTNDSAMMGFGSNLRSIRMLATLRTNGCSQTNFDSVLFCPFCPENSYGQTLCPFTSIRPRQRFAAHCDKNP